MADRGSVAVTSADNGCQSSPAYGSDVASVSTWPSASNTATESRARACASGDVQQYPPKR